MAKSLTEIRSLAQSHTRTAVNVLDGIMRSKDAAAAARVSTSNAILDRGWSNATQPLVSDDDGAIEPFHRLERVITTPLKIPAAKYVKPRSKRRTWLRQTQLQEHRKDHQAMTPNEIRCIVREVLADQSESRIARLDEAIVKNVASILISFGIYEEDRKEMRADFQNLRRWRKSAEQAKSDTFRALVAMIVTGFVGTVLLGVRATLGK